MSFFFLSAILSATPLSPAVPARPAEEFAVQGVRSEPDGAAQKEAEKRVRKLDGTGVWKALVCKVSSTHFKNTAPAAVAVDSDFRIMCRAETLYISRFACRRAK